MIIELENIPIELRDRSRSLIQFCANELMGTRLSKNLYVYLEGCPGMAEREGNYGCCVWEDDWVRPRDFRISIDTKLIERIYFTALAHEMVHVKQWAKSEMEERYRPFRRMRWMSEDVNTHQINYWDLPWEIEAHGREAGLFVRWCESQGYTAETHPWVQEIYYNRR